LFEPECSEETKTTHKLKPLDRIASIKLLELRPEVLLPIPSTMHHAQAQSKALNFYTPTKQSRAEPEPEQEQKSVTEKDSLTK
jgi:hypothetical protein